jgi:hypothetical protein
MASGAIGNRAAVDCSRAINLKDLISQIKSW